MSSVPQNTTPQKISVQSGMWISNPTNIPNQLLCGFINNNNKLAFKKCDIDDITNNEFFRVSNVSNQIEICKNNKICYEVQTLNGNILSLDSFEKTASIISKKKETYPSELDIIKRTFIINNDNGGTIYPGTVFYGMPYVLGFDQQTNNFQGTSPEFSISLQNISSKTKKIDPYSIKMTFVPGLK